ncbi:MAG: hypothetical protein CM1200mP22_30330 [Dehalococcoidia bacterium]|nr:MAG: hypothetical protein CM1200mP22_30330 [Dehalococcoidia bacterium]
MADPKKCSYKGSITISGEEMQIDFRGTSAKRPGCINAPVAVTVRLSYVCAVLDEQAPANQGVSVRLNIITPLGSLVNLNPTGSRCGNVRPLRETRTYSGAMAQALPE